MADSALEKITLEDGSIYEGGTSDGKFCGKGKYTWPNGNVYEGDFADGKRCGNGKFVFINGDVYEGSYEGGKRNGNGTYTFANGDKYKGNYVDGKRSGRGRYAFSSGDVYVGEFSDDERTGKGKYFWANGNIYEGDFVKGKPCGKGKYIVKGDRIYEGDFIVDENTGSGKYAWSGGKVYEDDSDDGANSGKEDTADTKDTVPNGIWEKITYNNGCVFEGYTVNKVPEGKGKYTWPTGDVYEGNFVNGERTGKGTYIWSSGNKYEGGFVKGVQNGKGKHTWSTGEVYEGDYEDGERTGKGKYTWPNGEVYEGDFVKGCFEGKGKWTLLDGTYYVGEFHNDKRNGKGEEHLKNGALIRSGNWVDGIYQREILKIEQQYENHCFLRYRGKGNSTKFCGKVAFFVIPVSFPKGQWTSAAQNQLSDELFKAKKNLERQSKRYGNKLELSVSFRDKILELTEEDMNKYQEQDVLNSGLGRAIADKILEEYKVCSMEAVEAMVKHDLKVNKNIEVEEVAFITAVNTSQRSYAFIANAEGQYEVSIIFKCKNEKFSHTTIMHEVCHLFGAVDYYYPAPEVPNKCRKHLGQSVMNESHQTDKIDDLTAYCIAWTDTISKSAKAFLDDTAHFTLEEIEAGRI